MSKQLGGMAAAVKDARQQIACQNCQNVFRIPIHHWSYTIPSDAPYEPGYEGFVELSKQIMSGRNSKQQQQAVLGVLEALMPPNAPATFRRLFPFKQVHQHFVLLQNGPYKPLCAAVN